MFENDYGEKFNINDFYFGYNIESTDNDTFDRVINPFDMNISLNYPYKDVSIPCRQLYFFPL